MPVFIGLLALGALVWTAVRQTALGQPLKSAVDQSNPPTPSSAPIPSVVVGPSDSTAPVQIGPTKPIVVAPAVTYVVQPPQRGAWDEKGWQRCEEPGQTIYEGHYQVTDGRGRALLFAGYITQTRFEVTAYIANPPKEIKRHPKAVCFSLFHPPWFRLNWAKPARNVDTAILYLERVLDEAINGRRKTG